ncbi:MAG: tetratricopeptide repeat protein, partial [Bacteroidales bacterium]|nr:tetratricopeptide repeat protein [Bacteroidales bacterium]
MKKVLISFFMLSFLIPCALFAQRDSLRNDFLDAESWFLLEEFADALPIYQRILNSDPGNDNLNYKIGICLLNDPYQKDQAIEYLVDASDNINPNYKENSFKERTAPPDVLYYLGEAYLVNELLNRAIESFEQFLEIMDREVYDEELVRFQIRACNNAKRLKSMPVDIDLHPLDSVINTKSEYYSSC